MSDEPEPEETGLVPAGERSLVSSPGGLAARGLALAANLSAQALAAARPGEVRCFRGHGDCVVSVAISPDGGFGASGSWDQTIRIWDLAGGREVRRLSGHTHRVSSVAFSPDGRQLISGSWDGTARLWDVSTGADLEQFGTPGAAIVQCVAFSPQGHLVAWGTSFPDFTLRDLLGGSSRRLTTPMGAVRWLAFSTGGSRLLSCSGKLSLSGEGRDNGALCLWDAQTGRQLWGWVGAAEPVLCAAFSADGRLALSSTGSPSRARLNVTQLWDVDTGREISRYDAHRHPIFSLAFVGGGQLALLGGRERWLRVWDVEEQRELHRLEGHTDAVFSVAVSADGQLALSGSGDSTVRLWRLPETPTLGG